MHFHLLCVTAAGLALSGSAAIAQVSFSGDVSLGHYAFGDGDTSGIGILDATAEYMFEGSSFGLGLDALAADDLEGDISDLNYLNLYAIYEADFGRFEFGHTQSASGLIIASDRVGTDELFQLQFDLIVDPIRVAYVGDQTIYGINYYGDYDHVQAAASIHFLENVDGAVIAAAMRTQMTGAIHLDAGIELLTDTAPNQVPTYRIGAGYEANGLRIDALHTHHLQFTEDTALTEVDVAYDIAQIAGLSVGASVTSVDFGFGANEVYGFGAEYTHETGFGLAAHAAIPDGGDNSYSVELTFDF